VPGTRASLQLHYPDFSLDVDVRFPASGVSVLFGHSGSGKTSLLRCIAGLERAASGQVQFNDELWQSGRHFLPPHRRPVGYVFQEASLLEHLSARGNLDYATRRAPKGAQGIARDQAIALLGIEHLLSRRPEQLSGGERQRVAIARALLIQPRLLLMDEPLAALDLARKQEILPYLERLKRELAIPIIYVSHSADEVARLADYLVVMEQGRAVASGSLSETLSRPDFPLALGEDTGVVLEGRVVARDRQWHLAQVRFDGGELWLRDSGQPTDSPVRVRILARDISLASERPRHNSILNSLSATVLEISDDRHPSQSLVRLQVGNTLLLARVTRRSVQALELAPGQSLWAQIKSVALL
jgi:molybdate transport system ATP-binding protein